jgi:hypothetical protein
MYFYLCTSSPQEVVYSACFTDPAGWCSSSSSSSSWVSILWFKGLNISWVTGFMEVVLKEAQIAGFVTRRIWLLDTVFSFCCYMLNAFVQKVSWLVICQS